MSYIVFNVGCIECGVSSNIVTVCETKDKAEALATILNENAKWREGGQNEYNVYLLPPIDVMPDEYLNLLKE